MYVGLVERLASTPAQLSSMLANVSDGRLDAAPEGEWTPRIVLAHLRDDEYLVMRQRLARMLVEDTPVFPDFDEKAWAVTRNHARDHLQQLLDDFALQRAASIAVLRALDDPQWERPGRHETSGDYTVHTWVEHWVEHDETHVAQIRRALGNGSA
jgi:hypothetical protein